MKKLIALCLALFTLLGASTVCVHAESEIKVILDGTRLEFDQPPLIINDRTMLPMRAIFEALGAEVEWDAQSRTAKGSYVGIEVEFTIDDPVMKKNHVEIPIDSPATIVNDRTLLPARAVAESLGYAVEWDAATRTVTMTDRGILQMVEVSETITYFGEVIDGGMGYGTLFVEDEQGSYMTVGKFSATGLVEYGVTDAVLVDGTAMRFTMVNNVNHGEFYISYPSGEMLFGNMTDNEMHGKIYHKNADGSQEILQYDHGTIVDVTPYE